MSNIRSFFTVAHLVGTMLKISFNKWSPFSGSKKFWGVGYHHPFNKLVAWKVVATFLSFFFSKNPIGEMIQFDLANIFQMG